MERQFESFASQVLGSQHFRPLTNLKDGGSSAFLLSSGTRSSNLHCSSPAYCHCLPFGFRAFFQKGRVTIGTKAELRSTVSGWEPVTNHPDQEAVQNCHILPLLSWSASILYVGHVTGFLGHIPALLCQESLGWPKQGTQFVKHAGWQGRVVHDMEKSLSPTPLLLPRGNSHLFYSAEMQNSVLRSLEARLSMSFIIDVCWFSTSSNEFYFLLITACRSPLLQCV